ncbi:MAG: bifunctional diguanylate cyclase/phosphodiesterase [Rhizobiaceae bacterium]
MAVVLLSLVQGVSDGANKLDNEKSEQAIGAALAGLMEQAASIMFDNAKWDDAVLKVYGNADSEWLLDTWGNSTADQNYDSSFIVDEDGKTLAAFSDGKVSDASVDTYFGPEFESLVATLPGDAKTFKVATSLFETPKGIAVVSLAPILPLSDEVSLPISRPRLLAFSKTLTPEQLAALGERTVIKGLKIVANPIEQSPFVQLKRFNGSSLGYLTWIEDRPGDKAKSAIQLPALLAIGAMILCMILLMSFSSRLSTRLQKSQRRAWAVANHDTLTELPNRLAITTQLGGKFEEMKDGSIHEITVLIADLDGFKEVNDTYGHQVGDQLLKEVASGLRTIAAGFSGVLGRLGGDEFAFIVDGENSHLLAEDISKSSLAFVGYPFDIDGRTVRVGISIGIATNTDPAINFDELMRRADVAMYAAKAQGKNQYYAYHPELDAERNARAKMAEELEVALKSHQIEVAFQPIVDAKSHRITGVEALARWQYFKGQWVPSELFIKAAEEFGQVEKLGEQVLAIACRQAAAWPGISLSVNISPAQFRNPAFVDTVIGIVNRSGISRDRLELEVTEGYLIENHERARPIIDKLRAAGFSVSLDDFGTGFSSIGYLRQFQFDKLKIDRSLISGIMTDAAAKNIVLATTVLAQSLNMSVTAEGVENEEEANLLRMIGCDMLQGYHFSRPQSAETITSMLAAQQQYNKAAA